MKRFFCINTLLFLFVSSISAQTSDTTYNFTLQQAIEYAYEHQSSSVNARIDQEIAEHQVKEIRANGLPQINGSFDVKDFIELPTSVLPASAFGQGSDDDLIALQFGTKFNATADLSASQLIYDPTFLVGLKAAKTIRELSAKNALRTRIDVSIAVSKAYYNALVSTARMGLINANVDRLQKLRDDTKAMYDNGFVEKIDYNRIALAYNNVMTEKENVERLVQLSNTLLKYQIGINLRSTLNLTDSLNAELVKNITIPAEQPDITKRIEYDILKTNRDLHALDARRYKDGHIPSIFAYGDMNTSGYRQHFDIFEGGRTWYASGIIGAKLVWNLYDGSQKKHQAQQALLAMKKTENDIINMENGLYLEAMNSRVALQNALASLKTQEMNLELANEVSSVTKIKYEQGVGSNIELVNAEASLKEAQTNYYNALYAALVAKIDLDKALGNIK